MKKAAIFLLFLLFATVSLMAQKVNIVTYSGKSASGVIVGNDGESIFFENSAGNTIKVKISKINKIFDADTKKDVTSEYKTYPKAEDEFSDTSTKNVEHEETDSNETYSTKTKNARYDYSQIISVGFGSQFFINYEKAVGANNSWLIGCDYRGFDLSGTSVAVSAFGGEVGYKWWFHNKEIWLNNERLLSGWHAGPLANVYIYNGTYSFSNDVYYNPGSYSGSYTVLGVGVEFGYQLVLDSKFVFNISTGIGDTFGLGDPTTTVTKSSESIYGNCDDTWQSFLANELKLLSGVAGNFKISIGFAF
jgi:hypothetical protein